MLGISLVVKDSVGIIHEGKDFGDYGYVRGYNSGGMWGGFFSQPLAVSIPVSLLDWFYLCNISPTCIWVSSTFAAIEFALLSWQPGRGRRGR